MRSSDRATHRFAAHYFHDGARWNSEVYAYDFADAEARCNALNMKLDGLLMATIPCGPATLPAVGLLARFACWIRNTIARPNMQG